MVADVVTEFIEGLVETYPGLQYLDGFPQVFFPVALFLSLFYLRLVFIPQCHSLKYANN